MLWLGSVINKHIAACVLSVRKFHGLYSAVLGYAIVSVEGNIKTCGTCVRTFRFV